MNRTEALLDKADQELLNLLHEDHRSEFPPSLLEEYRLLRKDKGRQPQGTPQKREIPEEVLIDTFPEFLGEFSGTSIKEILNWSSRVTNIPILEPETLPISRENSPEIEDLPIELVHKTPFGAVTLMTSHPALPKVLEEKKEGESHSPYELLLKYFNALKINFVLVEDEQMRRTTLKRTSSGKLVKTSWEAIEAQPPEETHTLLSNLENLELIRRKTANETRMEIWSTHGVYTTLEDIRSRRPKAESPAMTEWTALTTAHPFVNLENSPIQDKLLAVVSPKVQKTYDCFPIHQEGRLLVLAVHQIPQVQVRNEIANNIAGRCKLQYLLATKVQVIGLINKALSTQVDLPAIAGEIQHMDTSEDLSDEHIDIEALIRSNKDEETTVIDLLKGILVQAVQDKATDVHIASAPDHLSIRFRIDGSLVPYPHKLPKTLDKALITRIKIVASINTTKTGMPEDGKYATKIGGLEYEIRVTTCPTVLGEKAVLRIQPKSGHIPTLESLGFQGVEKQVILRAIDADHGLLVICGPTGAGKSTTLYAAIGLIDRVQWNVITGEQPVEIKIPGCEQTSITNALTFGKFVTATLRQDPDYIMIGETRDQETTEELVRAAITGHNVLTTLHTNDAPSAASRLIDLGAKPYLLADALAGVCAQRLLRRLCTNCSVLKPIPSTKKLQEMGIREEWLLGAEKLGHPVGCKMCLGKGYAGRIAVIEGFISTPAIREIIQNRNGDPRQIQALMEEQGSKTLFQHAVENVGRGICSLQDALAIQTIH